MKEFNLEKAKAGAKVCTRDGREARIICFDMDNNYSIVALVKNKDGEEGVSTYLSDGSFFSGVEKDCDDLMLVCEKKEGWVNVYKEGYCGHIHTTKEEAIESRDDTSTCIDTIHIEWEE